MPGQKPGRLKLLALFCASVCLFVGCTAVVGFPIYSGFLRDYKGMYRSNFIPGAFIIDNPEISVTDYDNFYVAPVSVYLIPQAQAYDLGQPILDKKAKEFRDVMKKAFAGEYTVVDSPGKGVLILKFAITDLIGAEKGTKAKALLEADFVDGQTGERVLAFAYGYKPKTFGEWAGILVGRLKEMEKETKVYAFENKNK